MGLLTVARAGSPSNESLAPTEPLNARLEAILEASVADGGLPGVQAAVVFPDGTVWTGVAGRASHQSAEDVRPDGEPVKVGGSPGRDFTPAWSPDRELIAFIGSRWQQ